MHTSREIGRLLAILGRLLLRFLCAGDFGGLLLSRSLALVGDRLVVLGHGNVWAVVGGDRWWAGEKLRRGYRL